ncbi:MAG TPA: cbb3-type cytochrome c oxidase subunit I [Acidimicrobiales bacterium]|nr:cbb3-type cytochrome c oxidase subunit I [Acidimicrobiales bacterium]
MTGTWLTTADHKRIGRMYIVVALAFLVVGGVAGALLRAQSDLSQLSYLRLSDLRASGTATLVLAPLWVGLATYLVPLQIGASRLAFPRLQSFAFWSYALGGVVHLLSETGAGPRVVGVSLRQFMLNGAGDKGHTDLWVASLIVVTIAAIAAAANLVATVLLYRTDGMTLGRLPMFSWATLVSSTGTLLAAPVFLAGLVLLFIDQHFGGHEFFAAGTVGTQVIWQHMLWLYGRPDVYLLVVPGLGAASDIVAHAADRPLANLNAARTAIAAVGFLAFGAWAAGTKVASSIVLPTYSGLTAAVVIPLAVLVLVWLDTLRRAGRPRPDVSASFVVAFILALAAAGLAAGVAAIKPVDGSAWSAGQLDLVAIAAPLLLAVGALHYWGAKLFGRPIGAAAGSAQLLLLFGGSAVMALGSYLAGWDGQAGEVAASDGFSRIAEGGAVLVLLGILATAASVMARAARVTASDAAEAGLTLEWATTSPPPAHNFDAIPEVRSSTPLGDLRAVEASA